MRDIPKQLPMPPYKFQTIDNGPAGRMVAGASSSPTPTTPTGGEPTAGHTAPLSPVLTEDEHEAVNAFLNSLGGYQVVFDAMARATRGDAQGVGLSPMTFARHIIADHPLIASAPTLAARVAELEGMLAVAKLALTQAGMELHEAANILNGRGLLGTADLFYTASSKVASAIAQLDKEAGGK